SLEPEENEEVVLRFIDEHPEFQLEAPQVPVEFVSDRFFRTDPAMGGMDGFFAAVLSRA
ncbi:MAG: 16S rRNA (cytosine(967)-C(5))-methyltransferase RsmB, partial [Acidobacteria bacterium]|nr:16S rRNA (cytosine(967)-C(5))-methyltransferase RsmB [Acidobacteriota bacterium]